MWGLWVVPLLVLLIAGGAAAALIWFLASRRGRRPSLPALAAIPLGCVALPILGLGLIGIVGNLLQSSDAELYEEVFGHRPTIGEDRMLFDDFGSGANRAIYMRAEPTEAERARLFSIPGAVESSFTLDQFVARGEAQGFTWWLSRDERFSGFCKTARIVDAHGFRGWAEFRIAECLDAGSAFPASANARRVYVIAAGRTG